MAHTKYNVQHRRTRTRKTNYRKRLRLLESRKPRLVIRPSNKNVVVQLITYHQKGDNILVTVSSRALFKKFEWKLNKGNVPSAYLTGLLAGKNIAKNGIKDAILDIKTSTKGSKIYAVVKGVIDAGIHIPHAKEMLPSEDRVNGKTIEQYATKLEKSSKQLYERRFSLYLKNKVNPQAASNYIKETKKKILAS